MSIYVFTGSLTRPMPQYGAANGEGVRSFVFDAARGVLTPISTFGEIDDSGWLVADPERGVLYATCEIDGSDQSAVAAFKIENGTLRRLNSQPTLGNEACHASLSADGRFLLVANYNGAIEPGEPDASVSVFPLNDDGALSPAVAQVRHTGSGPNPDRQLTAHAHCVMPRPGTDLVYVADLGIDRIVAYRLDSDGGLTAQPELDIALPPGLGPRHLVFSADGKRLLMVSELIPTVYSFALDAGGAATESHRFAIADTRGTGVQPAGILLAPDGKTLFVGLRLSEEILGLAIGSDGRLSRTGRWPSGGTTPRDFALSPSGRHLVVANQDSDRVTVFAVDPVSGTLDGPQHEIDVGTPMSITFAGR